MSFLSHYTNFASVNESPDIYHTWAGLSLISHIVGHRIWTNMNMWTVKPNMYVCLVGPPGIAKSTAMNVAKDLLKSEHPKIFRAPASITKESIVKTMSEPDGDCIRAYSYNGKTIKFSQMSVFANEMVSLLGAGGNMVGMIDFMTDIWDQPEYREKTKNKGDHTIINPFLNILGCFTTDTARMLMQNKVITGGMSRRCIFAYGDKNKEPVPFIEYTDEQTASLHYLRQQSGRLLDITGPFDWDRDGKQFYIDWYKENFARAETENSDVLKHFLRSKAEYCIKVSMLLAISDENPSRHHSYASFSRAVDLVTSVETGACMLFDSSGRNELASISDDVFKYIVRKGKPVNVQELRVAFFKEFKSGDPADLDKIIDHLCLAGKIQKATQLGPGGFGQTFVSII